MNSIKTRLLPETESMLNDQLTILEKNIALLDIGINELKVAMDRAYEKLICMKEEKTYPIERL